MKSMNDYISREAIIKELEEEIGAGNVALDEDVWINKGLQIALKDIKAIEAADVQLVRFGKWVNDRICSECGFDIVYSFGISGTDFCPCCGVKMVKDGDTK